MLNYLPEYILIDIGLKISIQDFLHLVCSNSRLYSLFKNEYYWQDRVNQDFGSNFQKEKSWIDTYLKYCQFDLLGPLNSYISSDYVQIHDLDKMVGFIRTWSTVFLEFENSLNYIVGNYRVFRDIYVYISSDNPQSFNGSISEKDLIIYLNDGMKYLHYKNNVLTLILDYFPEGWGTETYSDEIGDHIDKDEIWEYQIKYQKINQINLIDGWIFNSRGSDFRKTWNNHRSNITISKLLHRKEKGCFILDKSIV